MQTGKKKQETTTELLEENNNQLAMPKLFGTACKERKGTPIENCT
jgi:hypothetical protein